MAHPRISQHGRGYDSALLPNSNRRLALNTPALRWAGSPCKLGSGICLLELTPGLELVIAEGSFGSIGFRCTPKWVTIK